MDYIELIKFIASSTIGGIIGGWISFRMFIAQKRFEFKQQDDVARRDALREMLLILPIIYRDIHLNWEMPKDSKESSEEHIADLTRKISNWRSLFLNDKEALEIIREINSIIGVTKHSFYGTENKDMKKPGQIVTELKETIEIKIKRLDKSLTGRSN